MHTSFMFVRQVRILKITFQACNRSQRTSASCADDLVFLFLFSLVMLASYHGHQTTGSQYRRTHTEGRLGQRKLLQNSYENTTQVNMKVACKICKTRETIDLLLSILCPGERSCNSSLDPLNFQSNYRPKKSPTRARTLPPCTRKQIPAPVYTFTLSSVQAYILSLIQHICLIACIPLVSV